MPKRKRKNDDGTKKDVKYQGVTKTKSGRYLAQIRIDGKKHYPGTFDTPKEAAQAYDCAAIQAGRPTSKLNFLDQVPKNYKLKKKKLSSTNTTGFRGVSKEGNRFFAQIRIGGQQQHIGNFGTAKEAAIAWDHCAINSRRLRSNLNFPNNMKKEISKRKHNRKHSSTKIKMRIIRVSTYFDGRANHLRTFSKVRDTATVQKSSNERTTT
jgi:hypothetical protein